MFEKVFTAQDKVHLLAVPTIYFLCYEDFLQCISNRFSNLDSPKKQNVTVFKYKMKIYGFFKYYISIFSLIVDHLK